jgi:hypothetical protein
MSNAYTSTHIVQVTDTTDRNAYLKIRSAFARHAGAIGLKDAFVDVVPAHNTLDIGVTASELVHNSQRPDRLLLALNCAPAEKENGTHNNARSNFFFAELADNTYAGGTLNGLELSYVKGHVKSLFELATTNRLGSQFRSLEVLPEHLVRFSDPQARETLVKAGDLVRVADIDAYVPDVPDVTHVIETDNFRNVKLYLSSSDRELLEKAPNVLFAFGGDTIEFSKPADIQPQAPYEAIVSRKLFDAGLNKNVLARESSSRVFGGASVPMIATIRKRPAETPPAFATPAVGQPVFLRLGA